MKNRLRVLFVSLPVISILTIFAVYSCKKDKTPDPVITTSAVTEITQTTATAGGNLIEIAGSSIMSKGVCWSTSPDPTINDNKTVESGSLGSFTSNLTQLTPNTTYYAKAYAVSNTVTGYGNQVTFTTLQQAAPVISTQPVTSITSTTATSGGNLTSDGGSPVIEHGICWNTSPNPTTENYKTSDPVFIPERGEVTFTSYMTGLQPNTTYYVRSYAVNNLGKTYGNELSFLTDGGIPVLTTKEVIISGSGTAVSGGDIINDGGYLVTERGVCWNTSGNPTTNDVKTTDGSGTGSFNSNLSGFAAYTTYYVRAYATNSQGTAYGNEISFVTGSVSNVPTLTTADVTSITSGSAISGGEISSDGGESIISRGVCWSIHEDPTTSDNKTTDGAGTGSFTSTITGLSPNTTYYVRAYATNSTGTGYGSSISFITSETSGPTVTDADGNVYQTVTIGSQVWMVENLRTTTLNDNTSIPVVTDATAWGDLKTPGYTWYDNNEVANKEVYGALYNWYAVNTGKLCPAGWHVPTDADWTTLINNLGGEAEAGGKLKATGTTYWEFPNQGATNETGFSVLPGGNRWYNGSFSSIGAGAYLWSTTEHSESYAWTRFMSAYLASASREYQGKEYGQSVRCIQGAGRVLPVATTDEISDISPTSATGGGNVSSDGGAPVTVRGVCWNTSGNPKTFDNKTENGTGTGSFTSSITGLSENITYYVRAYATNSEGTAYGNVQTFSTGTAAPVVPTLSTTAISEITQTTASSGGNITSDGGASVTERGICWSTSTSPTIALSTKTSNGPGTGIFTSSLTGLTANTTYYVRAYATNSAGTAYGPELSFTTLAGMPTVTTTAITGITTTSATGGGNAVSDGGSAITVRGVCWSTSANPTTTLSTKTSDGTGTGSFSSNITGLTPGATYYVRAYATNSTGTAYGEERSFVTNGDLPVVTIAEITDATASTASGGGNVTSDGGAAVSARGVCWSTSENPVATGSHTSDGTGTGEFISSITGLLPGTAYYVRAYATNSFGTSYSEQRFFVTNTTAPVVSTAAISDITSVSAVSGGDITSTGGLTVTVSGICWGTSPDPTTTGSKTTNGPDSGPFVSNITGLSASTIYYVRAYATNSNGTSYGNQESFTTNAAVVPSISTSSITAITQTTASGGGNITSNGGSAVTVSGICWSTSTGPDITDNITTNGPAAGSFTSSMAGLTANTTYYVKAYATNGAGTAYGEEVSFTTLAPVVPVLTTNPITNISTFSAISGGNVSSDGGAAVSAKGVVWSTSSDPTIPGNSTDEGPGTGEYSSNLTTLSAGTTYYVRSYATNSAGTGYGNERSFTTPAACSDITVTHTTGDDVTPATKTVTYGVVETNLSGAYKCWITQNLGADNQASAANDATEASAGWYWQFNHKQGFKHDGDNRTPATAWIADYSENSSWTASNDPCLLLLGTGWRIPTSTEWTNADDNGGWDNYNDAFSSVLKLHGGGYLGQTDGELQFRGSGGQYWSINQGTYKYLGVNLTIHGTSSQVVGDRGKTYGFSIRCLRD